MAKQQFVKSEDNLTELATPDTSGGKSMISYMKALPFDHIIGAPLMACIKAQQNSAQVTWEAIREIGFVGSDKANDDGTQEVAMVSFLFQQGGFTRKITVPLLTLVPIPYMQIDSVDLKFRADMSTSSDGTLTAKYSNTMDSEAARSSKYNITNEIDINIHATTAGMPAGIAKLLDIFTNSCINVMDYNPEDYSAEIINSARQEAERIKAEAKEEADRKIRKMLDDLTEKTANTYSIVLSQKPDSKKIPVIANTVVSHWSHVTYDSIVNSLQNSTNLTLAKGVPEEEKNNICSELKKLNVTAVAQKETH